jgi:hypothetical protein
MFLPRLCRFETEVGDRGLTVTPAVSQTDAATLRSSIATLSCAPVPSGGKLPNSLHKQRHTCPPPGNRAGVHLSSQLAACPAFASNFSQFLVLFYYLYNFILFY